jgi:hypothetical protein
MLEKRRSVRISTKTSIEDEIAHLRAVSISKAFVHDGRAYFRNRRPIICRGICCSQSSSIGFKPTALAT